MENTNLKALIVPNDICVQCRNIGGIAGDAVNPVMTTDLSYDSSAFKMYPSKDDLTDLFISLVNYTKWRDFIIIYDYGGGELCAQKLSFELDNMNMQMSMVPKSNRFLVPVLPSRPNGVIIIVIIFHGNQSHNPSKPHKGIHKL